MARPVILYEEEWHWCVTVNPHFHKMLRSGEFVKMLIVVTYRSFRPRHHW